MAAELKWSNVLLPVYNTGSQFIRAYGGRSKLILTRKTFEHAKITGPWPRCTLCTAYLHTVYYMIRTLASTLAFFFLLVSSLSLSWTCCSLRRRRLRSFSFWLLERRKYIFWKHLLIDVMLNNQCCRAGPFSRTDTPMSLTPRRLTPPVWLRGRARWHPHRGV